MDLTSKPPASGGDAAASKVPQLGVDAAYIHIPFCARRCGYCNFTVVAGRDDLAPAVTAAIVHEIEHWRATEASDASAPHLSTIFFGGGTPSRLSAKHLGEILEAVHRVANVAASAEITLETNPEDVTPENVRRWTDMGFNRFSLGVQSFRAEKLRFLDREHRADEARNAVKRLSEAGGDVSVDLIFAAGNETLSQWRGDLAAAVALPVVHVSTYGLTIEKGSSFFGRLHRGDLATVSHDVEADMFDATLQDLGAAGFEHYEISNHARAGHRCQHNLRYWTARPWLAAGPGAASFMPPRREVRHRSVTRYLAKFREQASLIGESETLRAETLCDEAIAFGLRMLDGVSVDRITARHHVPIQRYATIRDRCLDEGLLQRIPQSSTGQTEPEQDNRAEERVRLSPLGIRMADVVSNRFLEIEDD